DGSALEKFRDLIKNQGGDAKVIDDYSRLPQTKHTTQVFSARSGYVTEMQCNELGKHGVKLGGGRTKAGEKIDYAVGFIMHKKIGDKVKKGEALMTTHHHDTQKALVAEIANLVTTKNIIIKAA